MIQIKSDTVASRQRRWRRDVILNHGKAQTLESGHAEMS